MTTCTFAGHREVYQAGMDAKIEQAISALLQTDHDFVFYTGGMGEFDNKCAAAVRGAKRRYSHLNIRLALVIPYMSNRLNTDKAYYERSYDEIILPEELSGVHYKAAIQKRNRWMVDNADCVIAYICHEHGGAWETVKYARKRGKLVYNLAEGGEDFSPAPEKEG